MRRLWTAVSLASLLVVGGCNRQQPADQAKLEEAQKQLEETKKQLEEAKAKVGEAEKQVDEAAARNAAAKESGRSSRPPAAAPLSPAAPRAPQREPERAAATPQQSPARAEEPRRAEPPAPTVYTIPAGTTVSIRTMGRISTKDAVNGTKFDASLAEPIVVDGHVVARRGADVDGVVVESDPGGRIKGVASMTLALRSIATEGGRVAVQTSSVSKQANTSKKKDAAKVGIGAGIGAAIGAIAGGGKGAAIGAGAGAAGGTGVAMATRGDAAEVPAESILTFRLTEPVRVQAK